MTTYVVQLTPKGRGAIASLLVDGPGAAEAIAGCFRSHTPLDVPCLPLGRIVTGRWRMPGAEALNDALTTLQSLGEEVVVCRTCEQRIEVHCHGGQAAVAAIVGDLQQQGCSLHVACENDAIGRDATPAQLEALAALARATTERTARILLDQYNGALSKELAQLATELAAANYDDASRRLERLLSRIPLGRHLVDPWQVVIAGPPNVGKSSLVNALIGYQRAVVFNDPGTTRDVVTVGTAIDGWPIELSDTAGLRVTSDPLESAGVGRARRRLEQADLIVWVEDVTQVVAGPVTPRTAELHAEQRLLLVLNQCDRLSPNDRVAWREKLVAVGAQSLPRPPRLLTSALMGEGLPELLATIGQVLIPNPPPAGAAVPFGDSQVAQVCELASCLTRSDWQAAANLAGQMVG